MHVVVMVVENILNNQPSNVVYNTRRQVYDTEPLDLDKRPGKETRQKYIYPSTVTRSLTVTELFRKASSSNESAFYE